jgi:plasmid maintenance system antidote protein VapI
MALGIRKDREYSDAYYIEKAKLKFSRLIKILMRTNEISSKELALKLKCTPANISKLINNEGNLRLETMVKLARAAGGDFHFEIKNRLLIANWERTNISCSPAEILFDASQFKTNDSRPSRSLGLNQKDCSDSDLEYAA